MTKSILSLFLGLPCMTALSLGATASEDAAIAKEHCGYAELYPCPQPIDKYLPDVANMLKWGEEARIIGQRNSYRNNPGTAFLAGANVFPLPEAAPDMQLNPWETSYSRDGKQVTLKQFQADQMVQGMLVIKDGKIAYEYYAGGNTPTSLWSSHSVGKSFVSTLVAIAMKEGSIGSLDDQVTKYEPQLKGGGWDGVTLRNLINMDSGIDWNETYTDPNSDFSEPDPEIRARS